MVNVLRTDPSAGAKVEITAADVAALQWKPSRVGVQHLVGGDGEVDVIRGYSRDSQIRMYTEAERRRPLADILGAVLGLQPVVAQRPGRRQAKPEGIARLIGDHARGGDRVAGSTRLLPQLSAGKSVNCVAVLRLC